MTQLKRDLRWLLENYWDDFLRNLRKLLYGAVVFWSGFLFCYFVYGPKFTQINVHVHNDVIDTNSTWSNVVSILPGSGAE